MRNVAVGVGALVIGFVLYWHWEHGALAFDRARWLESGNGSDDLIRHRMADRLVASNALIGRARSEIETMLGPSNGHGYFKDECLAYHLGPERGYISIDSEWLVLSCNASGQVVRARVLRD
jgi:hypothetical protein